MRRRLLVSPNEGIKASEAMACDICLYNKTTDSLVIISNDEFNSELYPSDNYSPVGVVVVPGTHDVYGTGECGVISIMAMHCDTPTTGNTTEQEMHFGVYGTDLSGLSNLTYSPYVGTGKSVGDNTSTVVGQSNTTYLPSDNFSVVKCPHDTDAYYRFNTDSYYQAPSPYLTDDSRNPAYYQTSSPSSTSNCLADFDGTGNTDIIIKKRGTKNYNSWTFDATTPDDYPAASCCDMYYTDGTEQGDWYLPSMGELGYVLTKIKKINSTITTLISTYDVGVKLSTSSACYWSSTEYSDTYAMDIQTTYGRVDHASKGYNYYVRAFIRLK